MKAHDWLKSASKNLTGANIASARLDALILLEDLTQKDRAWLHAHPEYELKKSQREVLDGQLKRRESHEPLAYIRGHSEFYGREFLITPSTLQPRPETETMITLLKSLLLPNGTVISDIGTGSGAIAITAERELPDFIVQATDIQAEALTVAQKNALILKSDVKFYLGDLLEPLYDQNTDIILANLPYVPDTHTINQAAMFEPKIAIFGGDDGLELYRRMFEQISKLKYKPTWVLTESLPFQHQDLAAIAQTQSYKLEKTEDLIQVFCLS